MPLRFESIVVDCRDPRRVAEFWAAAFGVALDGPDAEGDFVLPATATNPEMIFGSVPEPKAVKNRLHVDLRPDDQGREVERLLQLGATRIDIGQGRQTWVVLADVEGNEFCVLRSKA